MRTEAFKELVALLADNPDLLHNLIMRGAQDPKLAEKLDSNSARLARLLPAEAKMIALLGDVDKADVDIPEGWLERADIYENNCGPTCGPTCGTGTCACTTSTEAMYLSNLTEIHALRPCVDSCEASRMGGIDMPWRGFAGCDANQTCSCTSGTCGGVTCGGGTCGGATCSGDSCGNTCGDSCGYTTNLNLAPNSYFGLPQTYLWL